MDGVLNVKEPLVAGGSLAYGDGCQDDTEAIQDRLDLLSRQGVSPVDCTVRGGPEGSWPPYITAIYFPAGVYRIPAQLMVTPVVTTANVVSLRLANPTATAYAGGAQASVVLAVGGGPNAGGTQPPP